MVERLDIKNITESHPQSTICPTKGTYTSKKQHYLFIFIAYMRGIVNYFTPKASLMYHPKDGPVGCSTTVLRSATMIYMHTPMWRLTCAL